MPFRAKFFHVVFLGFGTVVLCIGASAAVSKLLFERTAVAAKGRVIRLEPRRDSKGSTSYAPVVAFSTHDEREITLNGSAASRPPVFKVDEEVTVLYDPEDPHHAYIDSFMQFWGVSVVCFGLGSVFAGIPTVFLVAQARGRRRARWLKENGRRISTRFVNAERVKITVNGQSPYRIVTRGLDPLANDERVFRSFMLWRDPTRLIGDRTIDVLIDPNNPEQYWVDTDFLGDLVDESPPSLSNRT